MVKIKKMILHNFKTFGKKTEIIFGEKFNVVLGPNGSGKSNILDALCFVLGRSSSKSLRAERSANLIFNGAKTKEKPTFGSVTISFTNEGHVFPYDLDEIKITRIIHQSGQSIYKINDKKCTRQEILNLLSLAKIDPDGYNIIQQEDIVKIMDMSPLDRRLMIEEVAGINIYEDKKNKAINNLNNVEQKIKDAEIILNERKTYLSDLKKDRDQALKYNEIISKINSYRATSLKRKIDKEKANLEDIEEKISKNILKIKNIEEKIEESKKVIETKKEQIEKISEKIEQKGEKEQIDLNKQLENLKIKEATSNSRLKTCNSEIDKIKKRIEESEKEKVLVQNQKEELKKQIEEMKKELSNKQNELNTIETKIKEFKDKLNIKNISELEKQMNEIDKKADDVSNELKELSKKQQELFREKDKTDMLVSTIDARIDKINKLKEEHKNEINEINNKKKRFKEITLELNSLLDEDSKLALEISNKKKKVINLKEERSKIELKLNSMKNIIQSNLAIKKIMELKSQIPGIYGTISQLGSVDPKYSKALSILAGAKTKFIVVDNEETAIKCVKYLKKNRYGSASFIPLNKIRMIKQINIEDKKNIKNKKGVIDFAIDIIKYDPRYKNAFEYVFGNSIVIDNIETSRSLGIGRIRMVTLDGDLIDVSGVIKGGYIKQTTNAFKDTKLDEELDKINNEIIKESNILTDLTDKRNDLEEKIKSLRFEKANLEGEIIKQEKSLYIDTDDLEANISSKNDLIKKQEETNQKLEEINNKIESLNQLLIDLKTKKQKIREKLLETRDPAKIAELNTYEERKNEILKRINELNSKINIVETRCEVLDRDINSLTKNIDNFNKEKNDFENEITQIEANIEKIKKEINEKETTVKKFYSEFKEMFEKKNALENEIQKIDYTIDELKQNIREIEQRNNLFKLKEVEIKSKISNLESQFEKVKDSEIIQTLDDAKIESQLNLFEKQLNSIGNVNLKSLEVYERVKKEYDSLTEKIKVLKQEKEDVVNLIKEIDVKKKELFLKTYSSINENLHRIYPALSNSGMAELYLENKNDIFSGGVGIVVKDGGKKIDIRSLSGGQKTLLALSFIFSIEEYEPVSFYAFDEIEAHLDKKNSHLLAKLIKKYSEKAQYILISHNDEIISAADNLYGVSLDEKTGISKLISLKV